MSEPAAYGSRSWHPMSFSPKTQLVYLPIQEMPFGYKTDPNFVYRPGRGIWNLANASTQQPNLGARNEPEYIQLSQWTKGALVAWDPVSQKEVWRVQHPTVGAGGLLSTAGGLVFQGTPDGVFHAYRADNGLEVWKYKTNTGIIAGAMSYEIDGEQYVAILTGFGGANGLLGPRIEGVKTGQGQIVVFKLNGTATLPMREARRLPATVVP